MAGTEWADRNPVAITVCDRDGIIIYMNDKSRETFGNGNASNLVGKNLTDCHMASSVNRIFQLIGEQKSNVYTIEKNGKKKMIAQVPWYVGDDVGGLVELSFEIPEIIPHFIRG